MKPILVPASILLALSAWALPAHAIGRLADVTVIDRSTGATLPLYYHRGEYWVAGQYGAKYAIAVSNKLGERVLAVTAVDGVNVLSGETAAWNQTGYVFSPWQHYQMTGWRKSTREVAAFEFSALGESYAGRTGRPANVGVIGVALFRERPPEPVVQAPPPPSPYSSRNERQPEWPGNLRSMPIPAAPPEFSSRQPQVEDESALADRAGGGGQAPASAERLAKRPPADVLSQSRLGTGHGARESSVASHTSFSRMQALPDEVIRIRYDSRENLIASGVIRQPAPAAPAPNPFPESRSFSYVPDPY